MCVAIQLKGKKINKLLFLLACVRVHLWMHGYLRVCGDVSQVEEVVPPRRAMRVGDGEVEGRGGHHVARLLQLSGQEVHTRDETSAAAAVAALCV